MIKNSVKQNQDNKKRSNDNTRTVKDWEHRKSIGKKSVQED